jgi:hypothetical protein
MTLQYKFEVEPTPDPLIPAEELVLHHVTSVGARAYQAGYIDGLGDISNADCAVHSGMRHGGEAEELRMGIEEIIGDDSIDDVDELYRQLQSLLDMTDARDSLAIGERKMQEKRRLQSLASICNLAGDWRKTMEHAINDMLLKMGDDR